MRYVRYAVLCAAVLGGANAFATEPLTGCKAKIADIERELVEAREAGNRKQVSGLEQALKAAQDCNDDALRREREAEIREAEKDVEEERHELAEALQKGDADDIKGEQEDLAEALRDLERARARLLE